MSKCIDCKKPVGEGRIHIQCYKCEETLECLHCHRRMPNPSFRTEHGCVNCDIKYFRETSKEDRSKRTHEMLHYYKKRRKAKLEYNLDYLFR